MFIVLIPKKLNASKVNDYRPISLMNAAVKLLSKVQLLSKVLARRLNNIMNGLVSECQFAFIKGRQMSDCILLTTEVYAALKSKKST